MNILIKLSRSLKFWFLALAALLLASPARADTQAQAAVVREFFETYKNEMGTLAHPILANNGGNAVVSAAASGARVDIQYRSGDSTSVVVPINAMGLFPELAVQRDTPILPAFMSLEMVKALANDMLSAQLEESGEDESRITRFFKQQLQDGWENISGQDMYRYILNIRWVQQGYLRRYRNAASEAYLPPVDSSSGSAAPPYAPAPPPAEEPRPGADQQPIYAPPPPSSVAPPPFAGSSPESADSGTTQHEHRSLERFHDGFYFRASAGIGPLNLSFDDKNASGKTLDGEEQAPGGELAFGGSPRPGLVVGGLVAGEGTNLKLHRDTAGSVHRRAGMVLVAPFIDYFPSPERGLHLGAALGPGVIPVTDVGDSLHTTGGVGAALWLGYDFWVADQWSLGPRIVASGLASGDSNNAADLSVTAGSFKLLFTALYH